MVLKKEILSADPAIYFYRNYLSSDLCDQFIKQFSCKAKRSEVTDGNIGSLNEQRTSSTTFIENSDFIGEQLKIKLSKDLKWDLVALEKIQFTSYSLGEKYSPHFDAFDHGIIGDKKKQRLYTSIIYLNDDFKGGHTIFPKLDISVKPEKGAMLLFSNCINSTIFLNPFMLHGSTPIEFGKKNILTTWLLS